MCLLSSLDVYYYRKNIAAVVVVDAKRQIFNFTYRNKSKIRINAKF